MRVRVCVRMEANGRPSMSKLFTCGRIHNKVLKQKRHRDRADFIVAAVCNVMNSELSKGACDRWFVRLNAELGCEAFASSEPMMKVTNSTEPASVPRVWVPAKPKLTAALLDELAAGLQDATSQISVGSNGKICKVLARRVVESMRGKKGQEWLKTCGELSTDTIDSTVKLRLTLSRAAFELLVYTHARAVELRDEEGSKGVLELHNSDQTLVGRGMRGCGLVYCALGRDALVRSIEQIRDTLSSESHSQPDL